MSMSMRWGRGQWLRGGVWLMAMVCGALMACSLAATAAEPTTLHDVGLREAIPFLGSGRTETLDLYYPLEPRPGERFPGVVIIHGGGWNSGVRNADREVNIGANLARMGYVCVSIDYLVSRHGDKVFPTIIQDCKRAVQWLRVHADELRLNPSRIGCIGGSAGGHLSALLALAGPDAGLEPDQPYPGTDTSIQACVNLYGIMDFLNWRRTAKDGTPIEGQPKLGAQRAVMGSREDADRENWLRMSPLHQADRSDPPMLQIHGKADAVVDWWQARDMKARLDELGVPNELLLLDGVGHTFSLQRWSGRPLSPEVRRRVLSFYDRHLRGCTQQEADARYADLLDFECRHPEKAHYGQLGRGGNAQVVALADGRLTLRRQGREERLLLGAELLVERLERLPVGDLRDGQRVEAQGRTLDNHQFECAKVIYRNDVPDAVGRVSVRGVLRRRDGGWVVDAGRRVGVYALRLPPDGPAVSRRVRAALGDVRPGAQVAWLEAKDLGGTLVLGRLLLNEESMSKNPQKTQNSLSTKDTK